MVKLRKQKKKASHEFFGKSFQFVLSLSFSSIAVIGMLVVGTALYVTFYRSTMDTVATEHRQILEQVNWNLDNYLRNMMKISDTMFFRVIKNTNLAEKSVIPEMSLLYEANRDRLVSLAVFSEEGEVISAIPLSSLKPTVDVTQQGWFTSARSQIENLHFSTPHIQNLFDNTDYRYNWVVSLSRRVELTYGGNVKYGVLLVDMNFSGIEQICRRVNLGDTGYVYIVDNDGEIIYHPMQRLIYANLLSENNITAASYKDGNHTETFEGKDRFVTVKTVGYTGWKIIGVSYMSEVTPYSEISFFAALLLLFAISLMIFVNYFVSSRIANPIMILERSVRDVDRAYANINIDVGGSYEVRNLGQAINAMLTQIRMLMDEVVAEHELKRKSELDALQSQINPHFLYNALDSIVWIIENGEYNKAVLMVTALSRLFRISISKGRNIITVRDELEHARNYLTIQGIRFPNRFRFEINAEPEILDMATIKLIVQPIIENAIDHGMDHVDEDGVIKIDAFSQGDDLYIEISDNGAGMPEDVAAELLKAPARTKSSGSGIGLFNVQERIQLYFGRQYGLTIQSVPDEGTKIIIHLAKMPYVDESGQEDGNK